MNTTNARIRRELGWTPRYPTLREGFPTSDGRTGTKGKAADARTGTKRYGSAARSGPGAADV